MTATAARPGPDATTTGPPPAPLALLAGSSLVLILAGAGTGAALGGMFPAPFADAGPMLAFVADHPASVLATAVFGFLAALPLLAHAAGAAVRTGRFRPAGTAPALWSDAAVLLPFERSPGCSG